MSIKPQTQLTLLQHKLLWKLTPPTKLHQQWYLCLDYLKQNTRIWHTAFGTGGEFSLPTNSLNLFHLCLLFSALLSS